MNKILLDMTLEELKAYLIGLGQPAFRAKQVFTWLHKGASFAEMRNLPQALRDQLAVLCDGTVVPCCLDGEGRIPLGNLLAQPLDEILAAEPARSIAAGFALQKRLHPLCRRCGYAQRFR